MEGCREGAGFTYTHKLLLIIFRAHRRNTHPAAPALLLTLLAFRTRRRMSQTLIKNKKNTHTKKQDTIKRSDVIMLCHLVRCLYLLAERN